MLDLAEFSRLRNLVPVPVSKACQVPRPAPCQKAHRDRPKHYLKRQLKVRHQQKKNQLRNIFHYRQRHRVKSVNRQPCRRQHRNVLLKRSSVVGSE